MNPEIEKLISLAVATGKITEKNRATIKRKAESLGENLDEVEIILDGEISLLKTAEKSTQIPLINSTANKEEDINFSYAFKSFINNYPIVKYSLIFFLICSGFFLFSVLVTQCI